MTSDSNIEPGYDSGKNKDLDLVISKGVSDKVSKLIKSVVDSYVSSIKSILDTAGIALPHISKWKKSEIEKINKKIEQLLPEIPTTLDGLNSYALESARDFAEFTNVIRRLEELRLESSSAVLAKSLFTQLFAEFDSYMGDLLKAIYLKNNNLLKGISREISLSEIMDHEDLTSVKMTMLDKEIETFRRDSYVEQFSNLEKKFNLQLRKFPEWGKFVELSQRRNILMHNGGIVSDQYLLVCDREGYKFESRPKLGENVVVTYEYLSYSARLLSKVGLMLGYTLWSKIFPSELESIHSSLNDTIYMCLQQKRWELVSDLFDFALSDQMVKGISEINLRIRIINIAIGLSFSEKKEKSLAVIDSFDWSASYRDFRLAISVLKEDFEEAVKLMRSIGRTGELVNQAAYHTWPLFEKFRERPEFYDVYFDIYKEPFSEKVDTSKGVVEAHAKSNDEIRGGKNEL
ncbi:hypothetical protein [Alcaligenes phenolicus]|uniref:hypothetical protein n=1 Tax=Alcaligenes phenolicus TaxID=232846 RepID=UPI002AA5EE0D|nr:hypothetical protein [Alcaligenes phenolicus]